MSFHCLLSFIVSDEKSGLLCVICQFSLTALFLSVVFSYLIVVCLGVVAVLILLRVLVLICFNFATS